MPDTIDHTDPLDLPFDDYQVNLAAPFGPVGIICHTANEEFVVQISKILHSKREQQKKDRINPYVNNPGFLRHDYTISADVLRFSTGEGKVSLEQTVRGHDIFIISDVLSHQQTFSTFGENHFTSPDDHFRDLLRIITAVGSRAKRINVIMPFLYEGRQNVRALRESLDCASMLQELYKLGVSNLITFDPHDEGIVNAVPLMGLETVKSAYKMLESLLFVNPSLKVNADSTVVVTPDEAGTARAIFYSSFLAVPLGIFYRKRNYHDKNHPIEEILFLGENYEGKDIIIVDDMINSGHTMIETARFLKNNGANDIYGIAPFGLFTDGIEKMNEAYQKGYIKQIHCSNLIYRRPELLSAPWYVDVDMSRFIARIIDVLNIDASLSSLINPNNRISDLLDQIRIGELFNE